MEDKSTKKIYGFNLNIDIKERLDRLATKKNTKMSPLLNKILEEWLDKEEGVVREIKKQQVIEKLSPEELQENRAWELYMVERGDFHHGWAEEPARPDLSPEEKPVYLTPDNLPRDGRLFEGETLIPPAPPTPLADARIERKKIETQKEMEDREFDESIKNSLDEKE